MLRFTVGDATIVGIRCFFSLIPTIHPITRLHIHGSMIGIQSVSDHPIFHTLLFLLRRTVLIYSLHFLRMCLPISQDRVEHFQQQWQGFLLERQVTLIWTINADGNRIFS